MQRSRKMSRSRPINVSVSSRTQKQMSRSRSRKKWEGLVSVSDLNVSFTSLGICVRDLSTEASRGTVWGGVSRTPGRFNQYSGGVLNGGYDEEQRIAVVVWWTAVH